MVVGYAFYLLTSLRIYLQRDLMFLRTRVCGKAFSANLSPSSLDLGLL